MGAAKPHQIEEWARRESNREVAEEVLVRAGILQRCDCCGDAFDRFGTVSASSDLQDAYRIASAMFRDGDPLVEGYDRRGVLDTIKDIEADCAMDCQCARHRDD